MIAHIVSKEGDHLVFMVNKGFTNGPAGTRPDLEPFFPNPERGAQLLYSYGRLEK